MSKPIPRAKRTGTILPDPYGTIYEVLCPACEMKQFHRQGTAYCIFCDTHFRVAVFDIVRPEETPETEGED